MPKLNLAVAAACAVAVAFLLVSPLGAQAVRCASDTVEPRFKDPQCDLAAWRAGLGPRAWKDTLRHPLDTLEGELDDALVMVGLGDDHG